MNKSWNKQILLLLKEHNEIDEFDNIINPLIAI